MNNRVLSRKQVREVDRRAVSEYGMTGLVLMENAGRGVTDVLCSLGIAGRVMICCGKGNNAGDGFVIARHLDLRGFEVSVCLFSDPAELRGDAAANYAILENCRVPIQAITTNVETALNEQLAGAAWIVDALLGTGAVGEPREPFRTAIDELNRSGVPIFAVDLPSGLDCDAGVIGPNTIRASHTATFVAAKPGFFIGPAADYVGQLHVLDIGAPRRLIDQIYAGN
jgi:NAD(P)H-hydrate epimerase